MLALVLLHALVHAWHFAWAWYFSHGVPGNLAASGITFGLGVAVGYFKVWRKHVKPVVQKVHEVHAHLDPTHPFTLGGQDDGESGSGR